MKEMVSKVQENLSSNFHCHYSYFCMKCYSNARLKSIIDKLVLNSAQNYIFTFSKRYFRQWCKMT